VPLLMVCPCGHSAPMPETTGRYVCSVCRKSLEFTWFEGPQAFNAWKLWRLKTGRVLAEKTDRPRIEFKAAGGEAR